MKLPLTIASLLVGMTIAIAPTIASAQTAGGFGNSGDNRDPFSRATNGDTSGLLNMLNQVQSNTGRNPNYAVEQQQQINSASSDFRARQLEAIRARNKQKITPVTGVSPK